jgi:hypothetical protein
VSKRSVVGLVRFAKPVSQWTWSLNVNVNVKVKVLASLARNSHIESVDTPMGTKIAPFLHRFSDYPTVACGDDATD